MKRKIGPLPLWAWVLIAGGTLGLVMYMRSKPSIATDEAGPVFDTSLPTTAGLPATAGGGSGGGSDTSATGGATLDDIWAGLMNLQTDVYELQAQGVTDNILEQPSWQSQFGETLDLVRTVNDFAKELAPKQANAKTKTKAEQKQKEAAQPKHRTPEQMRKDNPAMVERVKKRILAEKKKGSGSGAAGQTAGKQSPPPRRTQANVAPGRANTRPRGDDLNHGVKHTSGGGQGNRTGSRIKR